MVYIMCILFQWPLLLSICSVIFIYFEYGIYPVENQGLSAEKTETEVHGNKFFFFKKKDKQMESFSILYSGQNA